MKSPKPKSPKRKPFRFLWITDPWNTLDHPKDTTLRLAQEAIAQGAESWWCDLHTIRWHRDRVLLDARQLVAIPESREERAIERAFARIAEPKEFDSLHYRTDPPVDLAYLHPLQLLTLDPVAAKRLVNPPSVLLTQNEKLAASALGELMPPTLASSEWDKLQAFGREEGRTVLKPLHQAQSKGIELLDWKSDTAGARAKVERATENFQRPILLQRYLAGIAQGEQRLWFVDGKLLACARKLPLPKDFRVDMDRGSQLARTTLTAHEKRAADQLARLLKKLQIRLAAVDLIDGYVTDFNFTSPGLITQMETTLQQDLAKPLIKALLKRKG